MLLRALVLAGVALLVPAFAHAQGGNTDMLGLSIPPGELSAGVKLGTLGAGAELGYRPAALYGVRIDGEAVSFSDDNITAGRTKYHATANLQSYGALADLYPFGESFRVTGGLRLNENDIVGQSQSVRIAGQTVPTAQFGTIDARITFDKLSPYLGFGWGGSIVPGLNFTSDFGVMFHGNPKASLTASPNATGAALLASTGTNLNTLTANDRAELQRAVDGYEFYPVIQVGMTYKF